MMKYYRDVFVLDKAENLTQIIRLESTSPISAFTALDEASRQLPPPKPGESRLLKVYAEASR